MFENYSTIINSINEIKFSDLAPVFQLGFTAGLGLIGVSRLENFLKAYAFFGMLDSTGKTNIDIKDSMDGSLQRFVKHNLSIQFIYLTIYSSLMIILCSLENIINYEIVGFHFIKNIAIGINLVFLIRCVYQGIISTIIAFALRRAESSTKLNKILAFLKGEIRKDIQNEINEDRNSNKGITLSLELIGIIMLCSVCYLLALNNSSETILQVCLISSSFMVLLLPFVIVIALFFLAMNRLRVSHTRSQVN